MRKVVIVVGRKSVAVSVYNSNVDGKAKRYEQLYHPDVEFFIFNDFRLSMTILRKEAIAKSVMHWLQDQRISVSSLRYIGGKSSGRPKKVSDKQMETF